MEGVQLVSALLAGVILFTSLLRVKKDSREKYATLAVGFLGLHAVVFYFFLLLKNNGIEVFPLHDHPFTSWSSILRAHTYFTIALTEVYGYWRDKLWTNRTLR